MTIAEAKNFYNQDKKEYIIKSNKEFLKWFNSKIKNGYYAYTKISELQNTVDMITSWYEFKYPERELERYEGVFYPAFEQIKPLSKNMDFNQLMFRLPHTELCLIECGYRSTGWGIDNIFMSIKNKIPNENYDLNYIDSFLLRANPDNGKVEIDYYIKKITDKTDITLDELLEIFEHTKEQNWDYSTLKESVYNHIVDMKLRKKILEFVSIKLLYSENTIPEHGYIRAKRFVSEFNKHIPNLNLSTNNIDEIMQKDYKNTKKYIFKR
ncbi:MAG: hypothetical protein E7166_02665 [Firmicutes bacterium]|nr:hypothetical protein [Bacillota bacterium]